MFHIRVLQSQLCAVWNTGQAGDDVHDLSEFPREVGKAGECAFNTSVQLKGENCGGEGWQEVTYSS